MEIKHAPITPAKVNGLDYFRVPLTSGMCALVKFEEEAQKLQTICNAHEELLEAAKEAKQILDIVASMGGMLTRKPAEENSTADKLERAIAKAEAK